MIRSPSFLDARCYVLNLSACYDDFYFNMRSRLGRVGGCPHSLPSSCRVKGSKVVLGLHQNFDTSQVLPMPLYFPASTRDCFQEFAVIRFNTVRSVYIFLSQLAGRKLAGTSPIFYGGRLFFFIPHRRPGHN